MNSLNDPAGEMPPTSAAVSEYSASIGYPLDGERWISFYVERGWRSLFVSQTSKARPIGTRPLTDWQGEVRRWMENQFRPLITPDRNAAAQPDAFQPVRPWTPDLDHEDDEDSETDTAGHEPAAVASIPELQPESLADARTLLEVYRGMLTTVQLAHAAEQFEAFADRRTNRKPALTLRIPGKYAAAILHAVEDRLQGEVTDTSVTGEPLMRAALATCDGNVRDLIETDVALYRALLDAKEATKGARKSP